jgi:hypothetical protein
VLVFESFGARIRTIGTPTSELVRSALRAFLELLHLPASLRPFREIIVEYCDDLRPVDSPLAEELRSLGFVRDTNQTMRRDVYA